MNRSKFMDYSELGNRIRDKACLTERLVIRPYCEKDEDGLLELFRDERTMYMDGDRPILEKNAEFIRRIDLIRNGPLIWFFAEERATSDFVGYIMLQDEKDAVALGFALTAAKQHLGYGCEMVGSVVDTLFENGIREVRIKTWEKNTPCQKLAEKLGFEKAAVLKKDHRDPVTGELSNSFLYSKAGSV